MNNKYRNQRLIKRNKNIELKRVSVWVYYGHSRANVHKWGLTQSPSCDCGQRQTMNHIIDTCPLTTFEGGLNLLHEADDNAVMWLESTAELAK